jgi:hypothetical protein
VNFPPFFDHHTLPLYEQVYDMKKNDALQLTSIKKKLTWIIHESRLLQRRSLRGAKRRGKLMLLVRNDEITTLSSIARDDE